MKRKPAKSLTALSCWLGAGALVLWLCSMVLVTVVTAQYLYSIAYEEYFQFLQETDSYVTQDRSDRLGLNESSFWMALARGKNDAYSPRLAFDSLQFVRDLTFNIRTAMVITDAEGNVLEQSDDFFYFNYIPAEIWDTQGEQSIGMVRARLDHLPEEAQDRITALSREHVYLVRVEGALHGADVVPCKIEYILYDDYHIAAHNMEPVWSYTYSDGSTHTRWDDTCSEVIQTQQVPWLLAYESHEPAPKNAIVLYGTSPSFIPYDEGQPVTFFSDNYPSLLAMLREATASYPEDRPPDIESLSTLLRFGRRVTYGSVENNHAEPEYVIHTVYYARPLRDAFCALRNVYLGSFLLFAVLTALLTAVLKKRVIFPLEQINYAFDKGCRLQLSMETEPLWLEMRQLADHYAAARDSRLRQENELTRLNTVLEYAREAEENRRQMTSAIAHELKTPLAVIHSYTEGLQERINEEKREQYLQVILAEVQRMDGMVLEMLDLSRLEAGKVKLARDEISLEALSKATFDRLALALQAKDLAVAYHILCDPLITADEARIGQVITNFAANAVKYTPFGGKITVTIKKVGFQTGFYLENTCQPLSLDALDKVWDTFYRTDEARSGQGTGLGLAIAKSIIQLHGGQVGVKNTPTGVEFRFIL